MNQVILIGRLTKDPELSYTPNTQAAVCRFTIAVDRPRRSGGEDGGTDFIRITVWERQAENCDRYLSKGSQVAIRGRIETGSYKNREGVTVYTTDVVADRFGGVEFLGGRGGQGGQSNDQGRQGGNNYQNNGYQGGNNYQSGNNYQGGGYQNDNSYQGGNFGSQAAGGYGGQDTGFGDAPQNDNRGTQSSGLFDDFGDFPDTFQAAEDDIPF